MKKESIFLTILAVIAVLLSLPPRGQSQSARDLKLSDELIRQDMLRITKELGTTCTECHNLNNFSSDAKASYKIGAQHIKIVAVLKANGFDGKKGPEANCYMCHRGELRPPVRPQK